MKNTAAVESTTSYWRLAVLLFALALTLFLLFSSSHISHEQIQMIAPDVLGYIEANPLQGILIFAVFYGVICALPMPFISVFTMLAGYLFGNVIGLLLVSFMSAVGNALLFLVVRYSLRDWVASRLSSMPSILQKAAGTDNFSAAFSLRLIPGLPFPVPAVALALSRLQLWKFYLSTQLGLLIPLAVYVNAGRSFSQIDSIEGILSPQLIVSLLLLGIARKRFSFVDQ